MSEDSNLESNNLCIPEDAFDKFQAQSMYDEEDYITLSDILPESETSELRSNIGEIPYDNEVVLSNYDEQYDVNSGKDFGVEQKESTELNPTNVQPQEPQSPEICAEIQQPSQVSPTDTDKKTTRPRRNIKKKISEDFLELSNLGDRSSSTILTKTPAKRGRKPKNCLQNGNSSEQTPEAPKQVRKRASHKTFSTRKSYGRRRDSKKLQDGFTSDTTELETNGENGYDIKEFDENGKNDKADEYVKKTKRGRPKKELTSNEPEEVVLENKTGLHLITNEADSSLEVPVKIPSKRGRKKKLEGTVLKAKINSISDDDMDNMSLSTFKKTSEDYILSENQTLEETNQLLSVETKFNESGTENITTPEEFQETGNIESDVVVDDVNDHEIVLTNDDKTDHNNEMSCEDTFIPTESNKSIDKETHGEPNTLADDLLVEDSTKRPVRRKAKKPMHYEEDSDEDPFANIELSDDEPHRKKGKRYYSDDEYRPVKRKNAIKGSSSDASDSDIDGIELELKPKRKRGRKKSEASPKKKIQDEVPTDVNVTTIVPSTEQVDDIEICLQSSVIKASEDSRQKLGWTGTNEFENFLAHKIQGTDLKIKKVSKKKSAQSTTQPLEIPVLDSIKKTIEMCTQTTVIETATKEAQTSSQYEVPMKDNIPLSPEQSKSACEFLTNIVKTTSELGQLMTEKSEDFITKKINTDNVTDTFKMDYCVRKSFLLFKLAKHNLVQMEEDLSQQYEEFLKTHDLIKHREEVKKITAKKEPDNDSDCEIVEVPVAAKTENASSSKAKFNPKTVFLNKELSIKIAKKPTVAPEIKKEKLNINRKHSVWLNNSVMVKKVKPNQSFLAQDSRNKKPPDFYVTEKMVSDFFESYYQRQKAISICAPYTSTEWLGLEKDCVCYYFFVNTDKPVGNSAICLETENESSISQDVKPLTNTIFRKPETLFSLCTKVLQFHLQLEKPAAARNSQNLSGFIPNVNKSPETLFRLCTNIIISENIPKPNISSKSSQVTFPPQKYQHNENKIFESKKYHPQSLFLLCVNILNSNCIPKCTSLKMFEASDNDLVFNVLSLKTLCHKTVQDLYFSHTLPENHSVVSLCKDLNEDQCRLLIKDVEEQSVDSIVEDIRKDSMEHAKDADSLNSFEINNIVFDERTLHEMNTSEIFNQCDYIIAVENDSTVTNKVKTLFTLCVNMIQSTVEIKDVTEALSLITYHKPGTLSYIALENVNMLMYSLNKDLDQNLQMNAILQSLPLYNVKRLADICFEKVSILTRYESVDTTSLTINCVNTLSDEAFRDIETPEESQYVAEEDTNFYDNDEFDNDFNYEEDLSEGNDWVAKVQMNQLQSCYVSNKNNHQNPAVEENTAIVEEQSLSAHIKIEPVEEPSEMAIDSSIVKTEPTAFLEEMTIVPECVVTKQEHSEETLKDPIEGVPGFDVSQFETFVQKSKMMYSLEDFDSEIYSQSAERVRRQYDPDPEDDVVNDEMDMDLLVPQTFEPLHIETAKGSLMKSSSDEENSKSAGKKKGQEKRGRGRSKKGEKLPAKQNNKLTTTKEKPPVPPTATNEVAILTRRMKERIRQEEKKVKSSDSESEDIPLNIRREKHRKTISEKEKIMKDNEPTEEIQCNAVDSTSMQQPESFKSVSPDNDNTFSGFSAVDQNEITSYQKYVKFVYEKILPKDTDDENAQKLVETSTSLHNENLANNENSTQNINSSRKEDSILNAENDVRPESPLINYEDPVEMLECEPTMPIFEDLGDNDNKKKATRVKQNKKVSKTKEKLDTTVEEIQPNQPVFKECDGWHCYLVDYNDSKLLQKPCLNLVKLPETFVEMYFRYQDITDRDEEDEEVDRLTNLQSLNRTANVKDGKIRKKEKMAPGDQVLEELQDHLSAASPANSERFDELTPSEDEANVDDEIPPPVPEESTENVLAKSSLMDDNESDSDLPISKIKSEPQDEPEQKLVKKKCGPKSKIPAAVENRPDNAESLTLTADKTMTKELNLLHAPVTLNQELPETSSKGATSKGKQKSSTKSRSKDHIKGEDDSSSEEEKQWVSTKEKLLKRMVNKTNTASLDDAKRTKLVNEFIERRGVSANIRKGSGRGRRRRVSRKALEREKQMRVLSNELYGISSADGAHVGAKKSQSSYFKGRRNIRKVIDKKSLARSTVIANMEEFERKRRLNQRQYMLREHLGLDEGVNVIVINEEVCLEYDFMMKQPMVTVHSFFTKVMKTHQYEGVKFMWDACFETLEKIGAGHEGGGCILAHCMGLGKTLQVLALLHTVLTHPAAGMRRVLVCCPLSTVLNWVDEINKWIGPVTDQIKVFELSKLKKTYERAYQLEDWYSGGGIFIIGYELFRSLSTLDPELDDIRPTIVEKIRNALLDPGPDIVICDEGHLLKNDCSVLAVAMSRIKTKRRIVLTGTPMQNNLREYYCMVDFVKPNLLGTYSEYSNRFENPIMNGQHRDSSEEDIKLMKQRTHILHKVLEGCLQRQEASVLYPYLPTKYEYTVFVSLTKVQWDLYKHYMNNYANQHKTSQNRVNILKDFHTLQKIWSHPQVLHNFQMRSRDETGAKIKPEKIEDDLAQEDLGASEDIKPRDTEIWWMQYLEEGKMLDSLDSSNKFVVVFRILEESIALGDKVLIFSTSLITMDTLEFFLRKINNWSLGQEYYRLDGSVPPEVRQKWCREFNAENNVKTKLFLISTRAGSLGLNMVAANRVIILDTSWNPAHDIQSIFRVYRFGQKKDCYIYRLVALGTMEQKIYERSVTKQAVACRVVDEQQIDRHYNMAELTELYKYDETGCGVAAGVAAGVQDLALLRVARHPALHAVHEHDSLLRGSTELALPEHERAAAWMQFQQEQAHKEIQNQLTSSFTLHMPTKRPIANQHPPNTPGPTIKQEDEPLLQPKPKKGKKEKIKAVTKIIEESAPPSKEAKAIEDVLTKKIMNLLLQNNFQNRTGTQEITELVSSVRKMVAYGSVPRGASSTELSMNIANVLLGNETESTQAMPPLTDIVEPAKQTETPKTYEKPRRGRPRKNKAETPPASVPKIDDKPSTSRVIEEPTDGRKRRKAAIAAEKSMDYMNVIDLGSDDDWLDDCEPLQPPPAVTPKPPQPPQMPLPPHPPQPLQPRQPPEPLQPPQPPKETSVVPEKELDTAVNSIMLSDDEDQDVSSNTKRNTSNAEEVIPLHPSLLSNKNFIKIVAHTYLEGNPALDEDAATLAAQYSTLKALKELENTGKTITSGPIYDIAIKVLGIDILKKLHKSNPRVQPSTEVAIKKEVVTVKTEQPAPSAPARKVAGPKSKTMKQEAPGISNAAAFAAALAQRNPVPVGLFKGSTNITPTEAYAPPTKEESILPDDDDVIVGDPAPPLALPRRNSKPLILNKVSTAVSAAKPPVTLTKKPIVIPKSSLQVPDPGPIAPTRPTVTVRSNLTGPIPTTVSDTICLDSDDEDSAPIVPTSQTRPKRVALKSTSKTPVVPVAITANPQLTSLPQSSNLPHVINSQQKTLLNLNMNKNYVVIPATQLDTLSKSGKVQIQLPQMSDQTVQPQSTGFATSIPHNINMSTLSSSIPQNAVNVAGAVPLMNQIPHLLNSEALNMNMPHNGPQTLHLISHNSNVVTAMPQNYNLIGGIQMPQNVDTMNTMPHNLNMNLNMVPSIKLPQNTQMAQNMSSVPQAIPLNTGPQYSTNLNPTPQTVAPKLKPVLPGNVPESIVKSQMLNQPTRNKTVCKPGDILRITESGQVEILSRPPDAEKLPEKTAKTKSSKRIRKISSSSSSTSDSSRPASPVAAARHPEPEEEASEDPMSIFRNVVRIQAVDDYENPKKSSRSETPIAPKPTVTKDKVMYPTNNKPKSYATSTKSDSKKSYGSNSVLGNTSIKQSASNPPPPTKSSTSSCNDLKKMANQIHQTDSVLKKLDKVLGVGKPAPKSFASTSKQNTKSTVVYDSVDLTDPDPVPSTSKSTSKNVGKPVSNPLLKKDAPVKVVGTSKNIIISGSGKASTSSTVDNSSKKAIKVTNVEKISWSDPKKRASSLAPPFAPKKKKIESMTLKDFNIDDFDDIIELE